MEVRQVESVKKFLVVDKIVVLKVRKMDEILNERVQMRKRNSTLGAFKI
jgi:hypothetical protein